MGLIVAKLLSKTNFKKETVSCVTMSRLFDCVNQRSPYLVVMGQESYSSVYVCMSKILIVRNASRSLVRPRWSQTWHCITSRPSKEVWPQQTTDRRPSIHVKYAVQTAFRSDCDMNRFRAYQTFDYISLKLCFTPIYHFCNAWHVIEFWKNVFTAFRIIIYHKWLNKLCQNISTDNLILSQYHLNNNPCITTEFNETLQNCMFISF